MKILLMFAVLALLAGMGCSSSPHKAEKIETSMTTSEKVGNDGSSIGVKDGNMVFQKKVQMNEELRALQIEVYELEDRVYGNRKFGSKGLHGVLKRCRTELASAKFGGDGKLRYVPPIDRVTDKEEEYKIGVDENDKIIAVSEEFLKDRIARFQDYKRVLQKREDEMQESVDICEADLQSKKTVIEKKD